MSGGSLFFACKNIIIFAKKTFFQYFSVVHQKNMSFINGYLKCLYPFAIVELARIDAELAVKNGILKHEVFCIGKVEN